MQEPEVIDQNKYREFILDAIEDGYTEQIHGVWGIPKHPHEKDESGKYITVGRREGDKTVALVKDDVVLWFVDRTIATVKNHEAWVKGWFDHGKMAMMQVPERYSPKAIEDLRGVCHYCKKPGDPSRLNMISFAGKVCPECDTKELRNKIEFPGWTD